jgi:hypothetical protein
VGRDRNGVGENGTGRIVERGRMEGTGYGVTGCQEVRVCQKGESGR